MNEAERQVGAALGRIASGLFVVTARQERAETGMLASWVQQCAFEPPHITVAIRRDRPMVAWLIPGSTFVVNILDDTQTDMIIHFGRGVSTEGEPFLGVEVERLESGLAVLSEALAYLECRLIGRHAVGDHDVMFGEVIGGRLLGNGHPMVHIRKSGFHY